MVTPIKIESEFLTKHHKNPVLTPQNIPYSSAQVYNAGITKFNGKYVMIFRNDYGWNQKDFELYELAKGPAPTCRINLGLALSNNGIDWTIIPTPVFSIETEEIHRAYDPRLTVIDGRCYMCFAVDTKHGVRGGIAVTDDFDKFKILHMTVPDNRNMVLFPEKVNGEFLRLERPFPVYSREKNEAFDIWISSSPDCKYWGNHRLLLGAENVPFCNCKIGPGAPPVRTPEGWLTTFHAVKRVDREIYAWHRDWHKIYYGGIMLLDLEDPSRIIGMCNEPIIKPEEPYELKGMRGEVVFPGGMILEDSGEVKIYYGAADTVECLATAHVDDLIGLCMNGKSTGVRNKNKALCAV